MTNEIDKQTENTIKTVDDALYSRWYKKNKNFLKRYISENVKIEIDNATAIIRVEGEIVGAWSNCTNDKLMNELFELRSAIGDIRNQMYPRVTSTSLGRF